MDTISPLVEARRVILPEREACLEVTFHKPSTDGASMHTQNLELVFEKTPEDLRTSYEGRILYGNSVQYRNYKEHNPELLKQRDALIAQAKEIGTLYSREARIQPLIELVHTTISRANPAIIEKMSLERPEEAEWIRKNILKPTWETRIHVLDLLHYKHGVCRNYAWLFLWLAKHAGLTGRLLRTNADQLLNIRHPHLDRPLWNSFPEGTIGPAPHLWVELYMKEDTWLPIDPTTKLVGDTPEGLKAFHDARYYAVHHIDNYFRVSHPEIAVRVEEVGFHPGDSQTQVLMQGHAETTKRKMQQIMKAPPFIIIRKHLLKKFESLHLIDVRLDGDTIFKRKFLKEIPSQET